LRSKPGRLLPLLGTLGTAGLIAVLVAQDAAEVLGGSAVLAWAVALLGLATFLALTALAWLVVAVQGIRSTGRLLGRVPKAPMTAALLLLIEADLICGAVYVGAVALVSGTGAFPSAAGAWLSLVVGATAAMALTLTHWFLVATRWLLPGPRRAGSPEATPAERGQPLEAETVSLESESFPQQAAAQGTAAPSSRVRWPLPVALALSAGLSTAFIARTPFRVNGELFFSLFDDAMISMRYGANLAGGSGLVWNPGEAPVEGYSNFLWTLWMAALHLLGMPESKVSLLVMLSGVAILLANLVVVRAIAAEVMPRSRLAVAVALILTALYYPLVYWTLRGMEVGLMTLVVSSLVLLALRLRSRFTAGRLAALAGLLAVAVLTRDDGLVPGAVACAFAFLTARPEHRRTVAIALLGTLTVVIGLHELLRYLYYGDLLPNTYYLKVQGAGLGQRVGRGLVSLEESGRAQLYGPLAIVVGGVVMAGRRALRPETYLLAGIFAAQAAYSIYVGGDAWEYMEITNRYLTPGMPLLFLLCGFALQSYAAYDASTFGRARRIVAVAAVAALIPIAAAPLGPLEQVAEFLKDRSYQFTDDAVEGAASVLLTFTALALLYAALRSRNVERLLAPLGARRVRCVTTGTLALVLLVGVTGQAMWRWVGDNASNVKNDAYMTRYGLAIRDATRPSASVAVVWAGALPYFAHRRAVDLLGKSDPVIAREAPATSEFAPGHTKWDYGYSIVRLRPDLVAQLVTATPADREMIEQAGFREVGPASSSIALPPHLPPDASCSQALARSPTVNLSPGTLRARCRSITPFGGGLR